MSNFNESLIHRLRIRAEIRRSIQTRKSVQEGKPDRISDLLEEAATFIEKEIKMENQHRIIKGYRELSQEEINMMNEIKAKGEELNELIIKLETASNVGLNGKVDLRWLAIGKTDLQKGIMALVRSIAKPESF